MSQSLSSPRLEHEAPPAPDRSAIARVARRGGGRTTGGAEQPLCAQASPVPPANSAKTQDADSPQTQTATDARSGPLLIYEARLCTLCVVRAPRNHRQQGPLNVK